jgi:protein-S-isoprenylcysteine O-methyltransferase Ste14
MKASEGPAMTPERAILVVWSLWLASWIAAAFWSDRAQRRPLIRQEALYRTLTLCGAVLLFAGFGRHRFLGSRLWDLDRTADWLLAAITLCGLLFTWWARLHLGRLWSSSVTRKPAHHVVDTGPYAIVRHPIYTGLIAASFATAVSRGAAATLAGAVLLTLGFVIKARLEERFLREELGPDAYDAYRRRVSMLIPFGPKSA